MVATVQLHPARSVPSTFRRQARRRLTILVCTAIAVVLAPLLFGVVGAIQGGDSSTVAPAAAAPSATATYVVQPGDTLWTIASRIAPGHDVRATVDDLVRLNGSAALQVGQRLRIDTGG
jgi:hypothetical protein